MSGYVRGALAAMALAGLAAGPVAAQGLGGPWYIKGFGGATWPQSDDFELNEQASSDTLDSGLSYDTGYVLGIAAGLGITPNVAVEFEYAYRNADAELKGSNGDSGTTESNAFMANALYKFSPLGATGAWQPYAGGGLGMADLNVEGLDLDGDFDSDYNFAYQLIGGVGYAVNPQLTLVGELRFFGINDQDLENNVYQFKTPYKTVDLLFGATYSF